MDEVRRIKLCVAAGDLLGVQEIYTILTEEYEGVDWAWVFKETYLHACLKKQRAIVNWLMKEYEKMDPIQQIGVRHTFAYGKHLLDL